MEFDLQSALGRLKTEFIESSKDRLDEIDATINDIYKDADRAGRGEMFFEMQRSIHSIKGSSGTHGLRLVSTIAHRLEDYLEASKRLNREQWLDVQKFIDAMRLVFEEGQDPDQDRADTIVANLPSLQKTLKLDDVTGQDTKHLVVLVVMPKGIIRKLIGTEMHSCGFDISFADDAEMAISLALSVDPDLIICSYDFPKVNGIELANALNCIKRTQGIPFVLATSRDITSFENAGLPDNASVIIKDSKLIEKLTDYMIGKGFFGTV